MKTLQIYQGWGNFLKVRIHICNNLLKKIPSFVHCEFFNSKLLFNGERGEISQSA